MSSPASSPPPQQRPTPSLTPNDSLSRSITAQQSEYQDCLPCKLMGSAAFTGLGIYTWYSGRKNLHERQAEILKSGTRLGLGARKAMLLVMSAGLVGVGAYRLVD